jgi:hypothetical protein
MLMLHWYIFRIEGCVTPAVSPCYDYPCTMPQVYEDYRWYITVEKPYWPARDVIVSAGALSQADGPLSMQGLDGWLHKETLKALTPTCRSFWPYPDEAANHAQVAVTYDLQTNRARIDFWEGLVDPS